MSRLPNSIQAKFPQEVQAVYQRVVDSESSLSTTLASVFANPQVGVGLANLQDVIDQTGLEPWVIFTVAMTVAHERNNQNLWESFEPLAREAGVSDAVIQGIAAGTAPRGLLPKEGIWVHFTKEVLQDKMRDSTWQATTHLAGDDGTVALAFTACYYDMMARLNRTFGLESA